MGGSSPRMAVVWVHQGFVTMVWTGALYLGSSCQLGAARKKLILPLVTSLFLLTNFPRQWLRRLKRLRCQSPTEAAVVATGVIIIIIMAEEVVVAAVAAAETTITKLEAEVEAVAGGGKDLPVLHLRTR